MPDDLGEAFEDMDDAERDKWRQYFVDKRQQFIAMLETSIAIGEKLRCSI